jgi:hypothetical protein
MQKLQYIAVISQTSNDVDAIAVQKEFKNDLGAVSFERSDNGRFRFVTENPTFETNNAFLTVIANDFQKINAEGAINSPTSFEFHSIDEKGQQCDYLFSNTYFQIDVWIAD